MNSALVDTFPLANEREKAEAFRSTVMDTMAEGLYVVDEGGRLVMMNAAASRMLGWREEELRGKTLHQIIHFQHADGSPFPEEQCGLQQAQVENRLVEVTDEALTRKDGSILPVAYSASPLTRGEIVTGVVSVFRDVSEERAVLARVQREVDSLSWIGRIRDALDEDGFVLYSQPIRPLKGGEPSEELLLRMPGHKNGHLSPPGAFLPIAEEYGLIGEIDRWVIAQAIQLAGRGRRVCVNLSAQSTGNLDLLGDIERQLHAAGADPSTLVFEITETTLMKDLVSGEAFARGLARIGCGLALDDFGTGFGSFEYLKRLPMQYIKIDIDFVRELLTDDANEHLVRAIVGLAHDFGYETIAEGIEDCETLERLKQLGVDYGQGFYLGRPAPMDARS